MKFYVLQCPGEWLSACCLRAANRGPISSTHCVRNCKAISEVCMLTGLASLYRSPD